MTFEIHHCADSFDWLAHHAPDQSVDVIITDPPYSAHVHANMSSGTAMKKHVDGGGGGKIPRVEMPFAPLESYVWVR
jgi:hypothetical protein